MKHTSFLILITLPGLLFGQIFESISIAEMDSTKGDSRGVIFTDLDNDGLPDLFIVNGPQGGQENELYINDGDGSFKKLQNGLTSDKKATVGASFADVDNDGDLDGYMANWYDESNQFYVQEEGEWMSTSRRGINTRGNSESGAWGDYTGDGFVDLAVANGSLGAGQANFMTRYLDPALFEEAENIMTGDLVNSRSLNWVDVDRDNDLDLFIGEENAPNKIYYNVDGDFVLDSLSDFVNASDVTFGSSLDDIDNDGDLDLVVANWGRANFTYSNNSQGVFSSLGTAGTSGHSIGSSFGDYDNDGDLDLVIVNGFVPDGVSSETNGLYLNDGNGNFTLSMEDPISMSEGYSYGVANADYDRDGDLDISIANIKGRSNLLFKNTSSNNNWVRIRCEGTVSNRSAIGTILSLQSDIGGKKVWQTRHISSQSGYASQNSLEVHFGLNQATSIDSLVINWPSGNVSTYTDLGINQDHYFVEPILSGQVKLNFKADISWNEEFIIKISNLSVYDPNSTNEFEWDLEDDGSIDSTDPEPEFRIQDSGSVPVRLKFGDDELSTRIFLSDRLILGLEDLKSSTIIYPNPAEDYFALRGPNPPLRIDLINMEGKVLESWEQTDQRYSLAKFDSGLYLLRIWMAKTNFTLPLVKR